MTSAYINQSKTNAMGWLVWEVYIPKCAQWTRCNCFCSSLLHILLDLSFNSSEFSSFESALVCWAASASFINANNWHGIYFLFNFINALLIDDLTSNRSRVPHRRQATDGLGLFCNVYCPLGVVCLAGLGEIHQWSVYVSAKLESQWVSTYDTHCIATGRNWVANCDTIPAISHSDF